uniref:ABC-F family ATP-binding cassette domain-containing protein n=1 Tax=Arthrobacter sp. TaxID=1667 RepID=UPI00281175F7
EGGLLVVTHDRWFLDEISTRTWEVHDGIVDGFDGGYAAYVLARAERDRMASVVEGKRQQLVKKELAWLRRGAPARTSKPKFRIEAANALIADVPEPRDSLALSKLATARLGKDVLDLENVSLELGEKPLFKGITLRLAPGQRLGIVGVNGAGKTTLLRLLNGEMAPTSGRLKRGKTVQTAILSQDVRELDDVNHLRVTEVIEQEKRVVSVGGKEVSASQLVEQLGFTNQRQWTPVGDLSGGERRRLQLLRLLVGEPNVLMLDEPTNDLDTDTLAAVEDVLDGWPGTLVVVSHDRYLLERVTDTQLALLGDGKIRDLPGGVDQYLQLRRAADSGQGLAGTPLSADGNGTTAAAGSAGPSPEEARQAKKDLTRIERQMTKTSSQIEKINQQMSDAGSKATVDFEKMADLDAKLRELQGEQESLEEQWLAAAEILGE